MINRVRNKINQVGVKQTVHLIIQKVYRYFILYFIMFFTRKNKVMKNQSMYWKSYKYVCLKYKNKLMKMPKYKGTNEFSNKVWWCWLQGEKNAPAIQKICLKSLREHLVDRDIIIITEDNLYDYINFPDFIKEKYKKGYISKTHFSDLIRLELLIKYGGTWIDSTVYCTKYQKDFFDIPLFVYKLIKRGNGAIAADNWFITSEVNNPILRTTRDLLYDYWKKHNYVFDYFIFHFLFTLIVNEKYRDEFEIVPTYSNVPAHMLQYELFNEFSERRFNQIKEMSNFHKLTHKKEYKQKMKKTNYDYILNK